MAQQKAKARALFSAAPFHMHIKRLHGPHGFIINSGKPYDLSTDTARTIMTQIVADLERSELAALDRISNAEHMLATLKPLSTRDWYAIFSDLQQRWLSGDADLQQIAEQNRRALKL